MTMDVCTVADNNELGPTAAKLKVLKLRDPLVKYLEQNRSGVTVFSGSKVDEKDRVGKKELDESRES